MEELQDLGRKPVENGSDPVRLTGLEPETRRIVWAGREYEGVSHPRGGGFVSLDAEVDGMAWVGGGGMVLGGDVGDTAQVGGKALVLGGSVRAGGCAFGHAVVEGLVSGVCVSGFVRVRRGAEVLGHGIVRGGVFSGRVRIGGTMREYKLDNMGRVLGVEFERFRLLVERELSVMPLRLSRRLVKFRVEHGVWGDGSNRKNLLRKARLKGNLEKDRPALTVGEACYLLREGLRVPRTDVRRGLSQQRIAAIERGLSSPERLIRWLLMEYGV